MTQFRRLASATRDWADQLERISSLTGGTARQTRLRSLARALVDEITVEQERRRRSRT